MQSLDTLLSQELRLPSPADTGFLWSRTGLLKEIRSVLHEAGTWPGVAIEPDRHMLRFIASGETLAHLRWDGRLDVPLPAAMRERLVAERMAACDPDQARSDRVVWIIQTSADVERAVSLLRLAYRLWDVDRRDACS